MSDLSTFLQSSVNVLELRLDDVDVIATWRDPIEWERQKYRLKLLNTQIEQAVADGRIKHVLRTQTPTGVVLKLVK